jgi:hypothetical protein
VVAEAKSERWLHFQVNEFWPKIQKSPGCFGCTEQAHLSLSKKFWGYESWAKYLAINEIELSGVRGSLQNEKGASVRFGAVREQGRHLDMGWGRWLKIINRKGCPMIPSLSLRQDNSLKDFKQRSMIFFVCSEHPLLIVV